MIILFETLPAGRQVLVFLLFATLMWGAVNG